MKKSKIPKELDLFEFQFSPKTEFPKVLNFPRERKHKEILAKLKKSRFRSSFHLKAEDIAYIETKGWETIRKHAQDFIKKRLSPEWIPNDGKQTPMRGHPVFVAQHACACCCRICFQKWHHIAKGRQLSPKEENDAIETIMEWIYEEYTQYTLKAKSNEK